MHPPVDQWDATYVQTLTTPEESLELEKEASEVRPLNDGEEERNHRGP